MKKRHRCVGVKGNDRCGEKAYWRRDRSGGDRCSGEAQASKKDTIVKEKDRCRK